VLAVEEHGPDGTLALYRERGEDLAFHPDFRIYLRVFTAELNRLESEARSEQAE